jgi:hypothetical protein
MDCPQCGLANPPTATHCDCGYDFLDRRPTRAYDPGAKLSPVDIGVAVFLPPVGLILGLVRLMSGKSSGLVLVAIALVSGIAFGMLGLLLRAGQ